MVSKIQLYFYVYWTLWNVLLIKGIADWNGRCQHSALLMMTNRATSVLLSHQHRLTDTISSSVTLISYNYSRRSPRSWCEGQCSSVIHTSPVDVRTCTSHSSLPQGSWRITQNVVIPFPRWPYHSWTNLTGIITKHATCPLCPTLCKL
jgi:hypothetical protein